MSACGHISNRSLEELGRVKSDILREQLIDKIIEKEWKSKTIQTQEMIAEKVGLSRQRIEQIANNFNYENIGNFFKKDQTVEKIAEINRFNNS